MIHTRLTMSDPTHQRTERTVVEIPGHARFIYEHLWVYDRKPLLAAIWRDGDGGHLPTEGWYLVDEATEEELGPFSDMMIEQFNC